ncbi:MAG: 30S ribosomal protein S6 [Chloroflexi bacterium]|nr:30S ribosomal protein S6 [Chloroflexota bacterium]
MRNYELVMLVSPEIADDQVNTVVEKVTGYVTTHGGKVAEVKPWGRRRLAYHIGNFQEASYVQANFSMEPKHAKQLQSDLQISEQVIRHLLLNAD